MLRQSDDYRISVSSWSNLTHGKLIRDEVFEVKCKTAEIMSNLVGYDNIFVQIVNKLDLIKRFKVHDSQSSCKPLDIMLISYDSVSRTSWLNRLTKTSNFMFKKMKFSLLEGYNIVGDGTPGKLNVSLNINKNLNINISSIENNSFF